MKETVLLLLLILTACEKESNYRFGGLSALREAQETVGSEEEQGENKAWPQDGSLVFREDFDTWQREGYLGIKPKTEGAGEEEMVTATVMYVRDKPVVMNYGYGKVSYTLKDYAANPLRGFVELQQLIFYECGQHDSDGRLEINGLQGVSRIRFGLSKGGQAADVHGIRLDKRVGMAKDYSFVGEYAISKGREEGWLSDGEVFEVEIGAENVTLLFRPALIEGDVPVNDGINRSVRVHFLEVYSLEK
jgi:hypothetical protein